MNMPNRLLVIIAAIVVVVTGCGKKNDAGSPATSAMGALMKLQQSFPTANPDVQPALSKIASGIRYGQYETALPELDKLAAMPNLNDAQKKAVNETMEQIKKAMAATPAKPAQ
jgi:hypothetical protein